METTENTPETPETSDSNNNSDNTEKDLTVVKIPKGNAKMVLKSIDDGTWKGFNFYVAQFDSVENAIEHFTAQSQNAKDGNEIVLDIVNSAMAARMRSRANSKLIPPAKIDGKPITVEGKEAFIEERKSWLLDVDKKVLVTLEDAYEYVPGEREVDSLSGLIRQKEALHKVCTELSSKIKKATDPAVIAQLKNEGAVQVAKYREVTALIAAKQEAEKNELFSKLEELV